MWDDEDGGWRERRTEGKDEEEDGEWAGEEEREGKDKEGVRRGRRDEGRGNRGEEG